MVKTSVTLRVDRLGPSFPCYFPFFFQMFAFEVPFVPISRLSSTFFMLPQVDSQVATVQPGLIAGSTQPGVLVHTSLDDTGYMMSESQLTWYQLLSESASLGTNTHPSHNVSWND